MDSRSLAWTAVLGDALAGVFYNDEVGSVCLFSPDKTRGETGVTKQPDINKTGIPYSVNHGAYIKATTTHGCHVVNPHANIL